MLTPREQVLRQLDWFATHTVARFDLAVQRRSGSWLSPHQGVPRERVIDLVPWCRAENTRGGNVYLRAHHRDPAPVVFLDDVTLANAEALVTDHPGLAIETSPDRCHVWLAVNRALSAAERFATQSQLARRQVHGVPLADPGSVSGDHYGRLCGFRNRKPERDCWVNLRRDTVGGCPFEVGAGIAPPGTLSTPGGRVEPGTVTRTPASSASEGDWATVMSRLERGDDPDVVERDLAASAGPRRGQDAKRYAAYTVARAIARLHTVR